MIDDATLAGPALSPDRSELATLESGAETMGGVPRSREGEPVGRGTEVGRYVVLDRIGAGGMGVVYAAYDPELDRKVAVKLLHPAPGGGVDTTGRTRLMREAQALAKLSHPHVVAVHDVGTMGDRVWMAMEFVTGQTLSGWLEQARPWPEVVRVMTAAGEGLAAAHAVGLLHRDFKPDNVMIDADGRVRVMDFGLARAGSELGLERLAPAELVTRSGALTLSSRVTRAGSLMGTPGYMSPEQYEGRDVDAKSDQFAFCVTLWQALYGRRPYAAATIPELVAKVLAGERERPPAGGRVPAWLRRICERGLATDPGQRFVSMQVLLASLAGARARAKRTRWLVGAGAVVMAAGGVLAAERWQHAQQVAACEAEGAAIAEVWDDEARARVRAGLLATEVPHAAATASKVMPWLHDAATQWHEHRTAACLRPTTEPGWDAALVERARWCLDERRVALASLVQVLSAADVDVAAYATQAATSLAPSKACLDVGALQRSPSPPAPELRPRVVAALAELERARALMRANQLQAGLSAMEAIRGEVAALGWAPLSARAGVVEGLLLRGTGSFAQAEQAGAAAYVAAAEAGAWEDAASAAESLVSLVGRDKARPEEGRLWAEHAKVAAAHAGDPLGLHEAARLSGLAGIDRDTGAYATAQARYERALEIQRAVHGPGHPAVGELLVDLGSVELLEGELEDGRDSLEQALRILEDALGPEHPAITRPVNNLGIIFGRIGEHVQALEFYERVLAIESAALPPDHPNLAGTLDNLASAYLSLGDTDEALLLVSQAIAMRERSVGPDHPSMAASLTVLGQAHFERSEGAEMQAAYERAVEIFDRHEGIQYGEPSARFVLAQVLVLRGGDREHAVALARAAHEGFRATGNEPLAAEVVAWLERQGETVR